MLLQPPLLMSTTKLGFLIACLAYRAIASRLDLGLYPCPVDCDDELKSWTIYTDAKRLGNCNRPMLLDFGIHNSQAGSSDPVEVRACMVNSAIRSTESRPRKHESTISSRHVAGSPDICVANATAASTALDVGMAGNGSEFTWAAFRLASNATTATPWQPNGGHQACNATHMGFLYIAQLATQSTEAMIGGHRLPLSVAWGPVVSD